MNTLIHERRCKRCKLKKVDRNIHITGIIQFSGWRILKGNMQLHSPMPKGINCTYYEICVVKSTKIEKIYKHIRMYN